MGNIAVDIAKNVDFNKFVTKDIFKDVTTNVNLNGDLAEAEADAEAFGTSDYYALAETDTFAIVDRTGEGSSDDLIPTEPVEGQVDVLGNVPPFELGPDNIAFDGDGNEIPGPDGANDSIGIDFTGDGTDPPDVDDVNAVGALASLDGVPSGPDEPLPFNQSNASSQPALTITDLNLTQSGIAIDIPGGVEAPFTSDANFVVDFGIREVDRNGQDGIEEDLGEVGRLTLTVPADTIYLAEFLTGGGVEVEFGSLEAGDAFFTFEPNGGIGASANTIEVPTEGRFVFESETLGVFADYAFEAIGDFTGFELVQIPGMGAVEAFAYSESTAALDLIDSVVIPPPVEA